MISLKRKHHGTFTYLQNNTKTPRERNQPILETGINDDLFYPILETKMRELEKN